MERKVYRWWLESTLINTTLINTKGHPPTFMRFLQNLTLRVVVATLQHCLGYASAKHFLLKIS